MAELPRLISERKVKRAAITRQYNSKQNWENLNNLEKLELKITLDNLERSINIIDDKILKESYDPENESTYETEISAKEEYDTKLGVCKATLAQLMQPAPTGLPGGAIPLGSASQPNGTLTTGEARSLLKTPIAPLPAFAGKVEEDWTRFLTQFEDVISKYNYPACDKFLLLKQQLRGRALILVDSLEVGKQTYVDALDLLKRAFDTPEEKTFDTISALTNLKMDKHSDPFKFFSKFCRAAELVKLLKVTTDNFLQYYFWNGLTDEFRNEYKLLTNTSKPPIELLKSHFFEVCKRQAQNTDLDPPIEDAGAVEKSSAFAISVGENEVEMVSKDNSRKLGGKFIPCSLCSETGSEGALKADHPMWKCKTYPDQTSKLNKLKLIGGCYKCGSSAHKLNLCDFMFKRKCACSMFHFSYLCPKGTEFQPSPRRNKDKAKKAKSETNNLLGVTNSLQGSTNSRSAIPTFSCKLKTENIRCLKDLGCQSNYIADNLASKFKLKVLNSKVNLRVTGFNTSKLYSTRIVEVPLQMKTGVYKIPAVCINSINIDIHLKGLSNIAKEFSSKGYDIADQNLLKSDHINNLGFILGTKSAYILKCKETDFGEKRDSIYAASEQGVLILGDVDVMKSNLPCLPAFSALSAVEHSPCGASSKVNISNDHFSDQPISLNTSANFLVMNEKFEIDEKELEKATADILNFSNENDLIELDETATEANKKLMDWALDTAERDESGRMVMGILWNSHNKHLLGKNFNLSKAILLSNLKKFENDKENLKLMDDCFKKQLASGIIETVPDIEAYCKEHPFHSFIPHMGIINPESATSPCRVVFLANLCEKNSENPNALSHNQTMHAGYPLNQKISTAVTQLRFGKFILSFDLVKAFNQIKLSEEDASKLLFMWFKNPLEGDFSIIYFKNSRLSFGIRPAPCMLMIALYKMLIVDAVNDEPELKKLKAEIYQLIYVDNGAISGETESQLREHYCKLNEVFKPYGFEIQKLMCNSDSLQEVIDDSNSESGETGLFGIKWDRSSDQLYTKPIQLNKEADTKRSVLQTIASQYDMQNFNGPLLNRARFFMHKLQCDKDLGWDVQLDNSNVNQWQNIAIEANKSSVVKVDRCVGSREDTYDILACTDASREAYGTVLYLHNLQTDTLHFIMSKNKIVTDKLAKKSIPALELQGILLGVQALTNLFSELAGPRCVVPIKIRNLRLFSDSLVSLHRIESHSIKFEKLNKLPVFILNRLAEIQKLCEIHPVSFEFISGVQSPERSVSYKRLIKTNFLSGEGLLSVPPEGSCNEKLKFTVPNPMLSGGAFVLVGAEEVDGNSPKEVNATCPERIMKHCLSLDRFSSLSKLVNVYKICQTFINKLKLKVKSKFPDKYSHVAISEVDPTKIKLDLVRIEQEKAYPEVFAYFRAKTPLLKDIPDLVNKYNLYICDDGLIRVKAKFDRPNKEGINQYFPILLPKHSQLTDLVISCIHRSKSHIGIYQLLSELRKVFYIPCFFTVVKKVLRKCIICRRFNKKPSPLNQSPYRLMRMDPNRTPFSFIYADYIGPFDVYKGDSKSKVYLLCITCLYTRAVNLVVCEDASVSEFLRAYQLHTYSYSLPQVQTTDLGSNLVAGSKIISNFLNEAETHAFFKENGINPIRFENYFKGNSSLGGVVEVLVKFVKKLIYSSIKKNVLKFREFEFVVAHTTHLINRRPLCFKEVLRDSPSNELPEVITPQLLINGYPLISVNVIPELQLKPDDPDFLLEGNQSIRAGYEKLLKVKSNINEVYHQEFLTNLAYQAIDKNDRYKPVNHDPLRRGDLVLIKDQFTKPHSYPLGKVTKVYTNINDEVTNVEVLKGSSKEITKRHVSSVIPFLKVKDDFDPTPVLEQASKDTLVPPVANRPSRLAALQSREKTRVLLDAS